MKFKSFLEERFWQDIYLEATKGGADDIFATRLADKGLEAFRERGGGTDYDLLEE